MTDQSRNQRTTMRILSEGGPVVGYGHFVRTIALAKEVERLTRRNWDIKYIVDSGSDSVFLTKNGLVCEIHPFEAISDWIDQIDPQEGPLVIDTHSFGQTELNLLKNKGFVVVVFDDGCRLERYPVDIVIDSSPSGPGGGYTGNPSTKFCLGLKHHILRKNIVVSKWGAKKLDTNGPLHLVVTMGGSDPDDITAKLFQMALDKLSSSRIDFILGPGYGGDLVGRESPPNFKFHESPEDFAEILTNADIVISSGGGTALELCYLGVPMILISLAPDQEPIANFLDDQGAAVHAGPHDSLDLEELSRHISDITLNVAKRKRMAKKAQVLVDGGGVQRVAEELISTWKEKTYVTKAQFTEGS